MAYKHQRSRKKTHGPQKSNNRQIEVIDITRTRKQNREFLAVKPSRYLDAIKLRTNIFGTRIIVSRAKKGIDVMCRRCGVQIETLEHVLGMCTSTKSKRIKWHDEIRDLIIKKLPEATLRSLQRTSRQRYWRVAQTWFGYKRPKYGIRRQRDGAKCTRKKLISTQIVPTMKARLFFLFVPYVWV